MKEVEFLTLENFEKNEIADKLCAKVNRVNWKFMKGSIIKNDEIYDIQKKQKLKDVFIALMKVEPRSYRVKFEMRGSILKNILCRG